MQSWDIDGWGLGLPGNEAAEMLHHCAWAQVKSASFVGREELLQQALDTIMQPMQHTTGAESCYLDTAVRVQEGSGLHSGICLHVVGESGCGKTALMSKLAKLVFETQQCDFHLRQRPVIARFCGTSAGSSTGLALVRSLCRQIHFAVGDDLKITADVLQMSFKAAVRYFHELVREHAVVLLLDAMDQLSDSDLERSHLTLFRGIRPHQHTRIVLSSLPDSDDAAGEQQSYS